MRVWHKTVNELLPWQYPIIDRVCRTAAKAKAAAVAALFIDNGVEHTVEQDRILHAGLLARKTNDMMVGNARFSVDPEHGVDPLAPSAPLDTQHIGFAHFGTRFAPRTTILGKIKGRDTRFIEDDDLLFTGSDTCMRFARHTLTLKKRFIQPIRGAKRQQGCWGCFGLLGCPKGLGERAKKFASRCHLLNPCVHHVDEIRLGFEGSVFAEVRLEGVAHGCIDVGLRCMAL